MAGPSIRTNRLAPRLAPRLALGLAAVVTLAGLLVFWRWPECPVGAVTDDAYYIEMARSAGAGSGLVLRVGPDTPARNPDIFPPGFPLLLAPLAGIFPTSTTALKTVPLAGAALFIWLAWALPPPGTDRWLRLAITAVVALNPWVTSWAGRVLSDLPYAALALAALWLAARNLEKPRPSWAGLALAGGLAGAAVLVRTIGWAAALAIILVLVAERRRRSVVFFSAGLGAVLVPVWLLTGSSPLSAAYAAQLQAGDGPPLWRFALENLLGYVGELPVLLLPVFGAPVQSLLQRLHLGLLYPAAALAVGVGTMLLAGYTVSRSWRAPQARVRVRLTVFYLGLTAAALANFHGYPSGVQTRLLLPVLPLLVWLVLAAVWRRPRTARVLVGAMIVAAFLHNGWRLARPLGTTVGPDGSGLVDPATGADWIQAHTPADAVVMAQDPLQRHLHLHRPTVHFPAVSDADSLAARVARYEVDVVLVAPTVHGLPRRLDETGRAMLEILKAQPARFELAHRDTTEAIRIYRVIN